MQITMKLIMASLACMAAACTLAVNDAPSAPQTEAEAIVLLNEAGAPASAAPMAYNENLAWAASVVQVQNLTNVGDVSAKLFGSAGGDPAMNGLHTYLAFYQNPGHDWLVYELGNFLEYRVLSEAPGRVNLEIRESVMDDAGEIGARTRYAIVSWTAPADGTAPTAISIIPAQAAE